jgi:hypothetical protein
MFPKTKKILMTLLVSFEILALNIYPVSAGFLDSIPGFSSSSSGGFGSPTSMMKEIEKRYNLNPDSMKSFGQEMNVSEDKGVAPEVQLIFNPTDPKPGEEVTATAVAKGYQNDKSNLIYIWYIAKENGEYGWRNVLDHSDDKGLVNKAVNSWKIEAMRRIANNGFRADRVDWSDVNKKPNEIKKDGYNLNDVFGGASQYVNEDGKTGSDQHIYMHDYATGKNYELSDGENQLASDIGIPTCAVEEMKPYCVKTGSYFSPEGIFGTGGGEGGSAEGGDGGDGGSSTGGGGGGGGAGGGGGGGGGGFGTTGETGGQCLDSGSEASCDVEDQICPNGYMPLCLRDMPPSGVVCRATRCGVLETDDTKPWHLDAWHYSVDLIGGVIERSEEECTSENGNPVEYSTNVSCGNSDNAEQNDFHLFPTYDSDFAPDINSDGYSCPNSATGEKVGDGDFTEAEECFWGSNPYDPGTANNQVNDEAVVSGLGQDKLTWIYQPGDKVGVVIEGNSFYPTKYDDSSNMVMMAMPKNSCIENDDIVSPADLQAKEETIKDYKVKIPTIDFGENQINRCLIKNLVDPTQGGQGGKINVKLAFSPDNPINGQDDTRGDLVTLRTSLEDSNRAESGLYYKYTIYANKEVTDSDDQPGVGASPSINSYANPGHGWDPVTDELSQSSNILSGTAPAAAYFEGIGLSSVKFRLNEAVAGKKYLLAVVEVFEGNRTNELNAGTSGAIITLNNSGANLKVNLSDSTDGSKLGSGEQICVSGASGMCEVIPGQVIQVSAGNTIENGIDMQNYQWSLNGKTINCSNNMGAGCGIAGGTKQGGTIYFPVNGSPGDVITLTMNANDVNPNNDDYKSENNTGLSTNITKQFLIVEPAVKIQADGNSAWSAILGQYYPDSNDPNACTRTEQTGTGTRETNVCVNTSQSVFGTNAGNSVTLTAEYSPLWLDDLVNSNPDMFDIRWTVDGQEVAGTAKSVSFTAGDAGDVHNVSVSVMFKQDIGTRQAVSKFGSSSAEQYFSDSVQVDVFGGSAMTQAGPRKYFASLISNIPTQTVFMIRIALTIFVIILVSHIFSSASFFGRNYAFQYKKKR